ncbi:MAG: peptidase C1 [Bacteroidetes bacterium]|nr:peptidase C1 [Bacteroidota bacterium]
MPIRMVEDPNDQDPADNGPGGGGGGGGRGGLGSLLPMLFGLIFRYPKLIIPALIVGGVLFFWKGGCNMLPSGGDDSQKAAFATGDVLDPKEYAKSDIFNFLYEDNKANPLPEAVTLAEYAPKRGNQGAQGSCVAWSNAYAIRTILYARQTGKNPDDVAFSPSYLYNNIKIDENCQGSYIQRAVDWMQKNGAVPLSEFPYDPNTCSRQVPGNLRDMATNFTIKGAQRLGENPQQGLKLQDILQIKHAVAAGSPVAIGMMVGGSFMQDMVGQKVWHPTSEDYDMSGFGGHAMTIIGYDDNLEGGALQIMNSWGTEWGKDGIAWVRYKDFVHFTREAYAYAPMGKAGEVMPEKFEAEFGLVNSSTKEEIALVHNGKGMYSTEKPVTKGTPFKIHIKNNLECYTYVFGQETDNTCYVLYPYTAKHSPYCGVTGTRVFPRGFNMVPDDKGKRDFMAVLITRKPINYEKIRDAVNSRPDADFAAAFRLAMVGNLSSSAKFTDGKKVAVSAPASDEAAILVTIAVDK